MPKLADVLHLDSNENDDPRYRSLQTHEQVITQKNKIDQEVYFKGVSDKKIQYKRKLQMLQSNQSKNSLLLKQNITKN